MGVSGGAQVKNGDFTKKGKMGQEHQKIGNGKNNLITGGDKKIVRVNVQTLQSKIDDEGVISGNPRTVCGVNRMKGRPLVRGAVKA